MQPVYRHLLSLRAVWLTHLERQPHYHQRFQFGHKQVHDRSQTVLSSQESEKYSGKRLDVDQLLEQFLTENLTKDSGYAHIEQ